MTSKSNFSQNLSQSSNRDSRRLPSQGMT